MIFSLLLATAFGGAIPQKPGQIHQSYFNRETGNLEQFVLPSFGQVSKADMGTHSAEYRVEVELKKAIPSGFKGRAMIDVHFGEIGNPKVGRLLVACLGTSSYRTARATIGPMQAAVFDVGSGRLVAKGTLKVDGNTLRLSCPAKAVAAYEPLFGIYRLLPEFITRKQVFSLTEVPQAFFTTPKFAGKQVVLPGVEDTSD